jgi:hypothetical protein
MVIRMKWRDYEVDMVLLGFWAAVLLSVLIWLFVMWLAFRGVFA